jgi:hypothetical protein
MRKLVVGLALLGLMGSSRLASAEIGTADAVPAATLMLPYFEVDLNNASGITTLFSINNASASSALAHVTLWTDQAVPTLAFDVYLTGYDVQTVNVRDIFNGILPRTADAGADPGDTANPNDGISNKGVISQDINFPGSTGPCGNSSTLYGSPDPTLPAKIDHIRKSHTGLFSPIYGGCSGSNYGDNIARGFITVDSVTSCNLLFPSNVGYFFGTADSRNILWGDYFYVNSAQNFAQGDTLVHVEACPTASVGNGASHCPFVPGDYTFYGRYVGASGVDQREPLATTFATRYVNGGTFTGGTSLLVWRDTKKPPVSNNGTHSCSQPGPSGWFPLNQTDVVGFDEAEDVTDLCFLPDNFPPIVGGQQACFPLATQRVSVAGGNVYAFDMNPPSPFGWLYLNLNHTVISDPYPGRAQAWVTTVMDAEGRFSVGYQAVQLDNVLATNPGGVVLIP